MLIYLGSYIQHRFSLLTKYTRYGIQKVEEIETQSDEYTERLFNAKTLIFLLPFINYSSKGNDYNIIPLILLYEIFVVLLLKLFFPFYAIILLFLATILSQGECVYTNQELKWNFVPFYEKTQDFFNVLSRDHILILNPQLRLCHRLEC